MNLNSNPTGRHPPNGPTDRLRECESYVAARDKWQTTVLHGHWLHAWEQTAHRPVARTHLRFAPSPERQQPVQGQAWESVTVRELPTWSEMKDAYRARTLIHNHWWTQKRRGPRVHLPWEALADAVKTPVTFDAHHLEVVRLHPSLRTEGSSKNDPCDQK